MLNFFTKYKFYLILSLQKYTEEKCRESAEEVLCGQRGGGEGHPQL